MRLEENLRQLASALAEEPSVLAALAFGSVVRGTARPDSDLDTAVLFRDERTGFAQLPDLAVLLGRLSLAAGRIVHLVDLARADSALRRAVFATGAVLFDRSAGALSRLEHRTAVEYADWAYARAVIDAGHRRQLGISRG